MMPMKCALAALPADRPSAVALRKGDVREANVAEPCSDDPEL